MAPPLAAVHAFRSGEFGEAVEQRAADGMGLGAAVGGLLLGRLFAESVNKSDFSKAFLLTKGFP